MRGRTGHHRERARFPAVADDIGEDPARWLDRDFSNPDNRLMLESRIKGIQDVEVAVSFIEVERELERGPRESVVQALKNRIGWLNAQEVGAP